MTNPTTRAAMVAGQFYPASPASLAETVNSLMQASGVEPAPERVRALIAPHAGYTYSGQTAACAYNRIKGKKPQRVILLGCSHQYPISRASVFAAGAFESPFGEFPIDAGFAAELTQKTDGASIEPHIAEHSLEVQLPFLYASCGGVVPLVPVLFGSHSSWHAELGRELASMTTENDLVVASTDLSHYLPHEQATTIDKRTVDAILSKDCDEVGRGIDEKRYSMCGATAVICAMAFALAADVRQWELMDYRTSAEASGDYDRVVGYAAVSMETP